MSCGMDTTTSGKTSFSRSLRAIYPAFVKRLWKRCADGIYSRNNNCELPHYGSILLAALIMHCDATGFLALVESF
jgi:hypothetical protein